MEDSKYLPIGSIVLLQGGEKKVMITGFCVIPNDKPHKMYDYCGFPHPEGCINSNEVCLFDHSQIVDIFFTGYVNDEEILFKKELVKISKEITVDSDNNIISDNLSDNFSLLDDSNSFAMDNHIFES